MMSRWRGAATLLFVLGFQIPAQKPLTPTSPTEDFADALSRSTFVFIGRVSQLNATTMRRIRPMANTVVVAVRRGLDTVFVAPRSARPLLGRSVTVVLRQTEGVAVGSVLVVFGSVTAADTSLQLGDVDHVVDHGTDRAAYAARLREAYELLAERELAAMRKRSAAVFLGSVESVTPVVVQKPVARRTAYEHAPRWMDATIRIERVFKTDTLRRGSHVHVLFPGSVDMLFAGVPRLIATSYRLFGLQPIATMPAVFRIGVPERGVYYILDSSEVRPPSDTARLKRIR